MKELKSESLRVRITPSERVELKRLAGILEEDEGVTARRAINALVRHAKKHNGKITLPIDLDEVPLTTAKTGLKAAA